MNQLSTANSYQIPVAHGASQLFKDFCAGAAGDFIALGENRWERPPLPSHWAELVQLLAEQNPSPAAAPALEALRQGGGTTVTGQQVGLLGGPMLTPLKAATAAARARQATAAKQPHAAIFWLASEDHDFAEINHVTFPAGKELRSLSYAPAEQPAARPVGRLLLDDAILPLVDQASEILGPSPATDALVAAYKPGRTFAQAFAEFYSAIFAAEGLLVVDSAGRAFHRMGAPVLRAALERADELHNALLERNHALEAAGYHAQVAVTEHSSLLFLIDEHTGARVALKRIPASAQEPRGLWQAGQRSYSTADLVAILDSEPERISPSALLRPVFQDFLLSTSAIIGGPAEIAYFAQSAVLYERIAGRKTPAFPRFSATLVEPTVAQLLQKHDLTPEQIIGEEPASLARQLAERAMPAEGKERMETAGKALDTELDALVGWMHSLDKGLGQSAETAAGKMRYQMDRLRRLADNFQVQRQASLGRHAQTLCQAIFPGGAMQERVHGAAYYFARYGTELAQTLTAQAANSSVGHTVLWL